MKRVIWPWGLSAVILAAAGGAVLVRAGGNSEKTDPLLAEAPNPVGGAAVTDKPADSPQAGDAPKPGAVQKKAEAERVQLLETVGCLTAAHYFQAYLNIGFIAEGKARGTYTDKDARKVLDSVLSLLNSTDGKLEALDKIDLDKDDRERLEQLRAASALLRQQGKELQAHWDTGRDENAARYESLRKNAWATISKLMGIDQ
ncbi:MAG TPA: hypothetical protein VKE40_08150 [Gemmataceae bacterium]|nr:hypothetical protein [Gemmataceae bacterium]